MLVKLQMLHEVRKSLMKQFVAGDQTPLHFYMIVRMIVKGPINNHT